MLISYKVRDYKNNLGYSIPGKWNFNPSFIPLMTIPFIVDKEETVFMTYLGLFPVLFAISPSLSFYVSMTLQLVFCQIIPTQSKIAKD